MRESLGPRGREATEAAIGLWLEDPALAESLVQALWFQDGIAHPELETIRQLVALAARRPLVAAGVADSPWLSDGVLSVGERQVIDLLGAEAPSEGFLPRAPESRHSLSRDLVHFFAHQLGTFQTFGLLPELESQPWFADGLSPLEMAFVVAAGTAAAGDSPLYRALLDARFASTRVTSLALAGDVSIYVFQNTPLLEGDRVLDDIESTARALEQLLDIPFPATDIILLVGDPAGAEVWFYRGFHTASHMVLRRSPEGVAHVQHEVAHYYFHGAPIWFVEGAAEFIEAYVTDTIDPSIYDRRPDRPASHAQTCLQSYKAENIRHFLLLELEDARPASGECSYKIGRWIFVELYGAIGERALGAGLRVWYDTQFLHGGVFPPLYTVSDLGEAAVESFEEMVPMAFSEALSESEHRAFEQTYEEIHGGVYGGATATIDDDHGDTREDASRVVAGEQLTGKLDHHFDFDYFAFRAEEGRKYELEFSHETTTSNLAIYDIPDDLAYDRKWTGFYEYFGDTLLRLRPTSTELARDRLWVAPRTGDFYVAIQNFGGAPGPYTFSLRALAAAPDDHGDSAQTATVLEGGQATRGALTAERDLDYFRLPDTQGQRYRVSLVPENDASLFVRIHDEEGRDYYGGVGTTNELRGGEELSFGWRPREADYFLVVGGGSGAPIAYTLVITEEES
ncbi:MAG: hypothetical protein F4152_03885 [Dehalococcoidia bacterium]|nr:hypothetical protein [Dehalococcoidia bacterium]